MFNSLIIFSAFHYNLFFVAVKLIKMPLKALSTSSASPSSTFYYPYPHCSYPPLQRPCRPSFLFCVLNLFAVLIPTASSTPPVHAIISFLVGCLFLFPYNNSSLLTDKNLLNHSLPPSTQLQPVCILPGIYYMLSLFLFSCKDSSLLSSLQFQKSILLFLTLSLSALTHSGHLWYHITTTCFIPPSTPLLIYLISI